MVNNLKVRWLGITIVLDTALTMAALLSARLIRGYFPAGVYLDDAFAIAELDEPLYFPILILVPLVALIWLVVFSALSIYKASFVLYQFHQIQPIFVAITGATLVFMGLAYLFFPNLSRFLFLYFYILDVIFLIGWRRLAYHLFSEQRLGGWYPRHRVLIVGEGELADSVTSAIKTFSWSGLEVVGQVNDRPGAVGRLKQIASLVAELKIDEVIFALRPDQRRLLQRIVFQLQPLPVNLRLVPDVIDLVFIRATIEDFAGLPLIGLREPAISIFDRLAKRTFDIVVSGLLLILCAPLFGLIVFLIKADSNGPVYYLAQRVGEGGRIFTMYKFRTMIRDADQDEGALFAETNGQIGLDKRPNDARITRVGRVLRRISMDELPQLFNVFKGDMSLVGPRPELPWLVERYEPWQYQRFAVPQGMTGWWQIKNRSRQLAYNVRVEDDLYYIHNYSFLLDLRILWMTVGAIIRGDGAY